MVQRIRAEIQRVLTGEGGGHRMSQAELDAYRRQLIMLVVAVATIALILILGIGAYYQYVHLPRQSVAAVEGENISRSEYWDFRRYELVMQINQYQQMAQFMEGDQAQQYQQLALQADQELDNVENADIDPMTVNEMIENRIVMDALDEFGIEVTDDDVQDYLVQYFTGTPISDGAAGPSADPTAEAWATATAEAQAEEMEDPDAEPPVDIEVSDDPVPDEPNTDDAIDPENGASDDDAGDVNGPDDGEATDDEEIDEMPTPEPEPTPTDEDLRATAEANQLDHERFLLDRAGISHDTFVELFIKPEIAREKIRERLAEDVSTRAEHVHAAHILVATQDAANLIYEELTEDGADFAELAEEQSTDEQTAPNGGDLGWFPRGVMVDEFDEVVFELDTGEISEPFQSEFGWHVATVMDRDEDRPVELQMLEQFRQRAFTDWMQEQREAREIDTGDLDIPDDPMQMQQQFQPPAGAPQPPMPETEPGVPQQEIQINGDEADDLFDGDDPFQDFEDDADDT